MNYEYNEEILYNEGFQIIDLNLPDMSSLQDLKLEDKDYFETDIDLTDQDFFVRDNAIMHMLHSCYGNTKDVSRDATQIINMVIESVLNVLEKEKYSVAIDLSIFGGNKSDSICEDVHIDCTNDYEEFPKSFRSIRFLTTFVGNGTMYVIPHQPYSKILKEILRYGCDYTAFYGAHIVCNSFSDIIHTQVGEGSYHLIGRGDINKPLALHSGPPVSKARLRLTMTQLPNNDYT